MQHDRCHIWSRDHIPFMRTWVLPRFLGGFILLDLYFLCIVLYVIVSLFIWSLYCLPLFLDLRLMITLLVSSKFSERHCRGAYCWQVHSVTQSHLKQSARLPRPSRKLFQSVITKCLLLRLPYFIWNTDYWCFLGIILLPLQLNLIAMIYYWRQQQLIMIQSMTINGK